MSRAHPFKTDRIQNLDGSRGFQRALGVKAGQRSRSQRRLFLRLFHAARAIQRGMKNSVATATGAAMISINGLFAVGLRLVGGVLALANIDSDCAACAKARIGCLRHRWNDEQGQDDQK